MAWRTVLLCFLFPLSLLGLQAQSFLCVSTSTWLVQDKGKQATWGSATFSDFLPWAFLNNL